MSDIRRREGSLHIAVVFTVMTAQLIIPAYGESYRRYLDSKQLLLRCVQPFEGSGMGRVRLHPVLLDKGDTKVALYGLGNIRDERLARMFKTPGCIEWCAFSHSRSRGC
jgi:hypothetical protein